MMDEEIIAGNKLIAEFIGYKYLHPSGDYSCELRYHSSWNWLMPVIEKIGKDYTVKITWTADGSTDGYDVTYIERPDVFDKELADFGGFGPLTNTWKCAVKFIEWHNQKFKNKKT